MFDVNGTQPLGVIDRHLIYVSANGVIIAVPIDMAKRKITGAPIQFVTGVTVDSTSGLAQAAIAANGTLFYLSGNSNSKVIL